MRGRVESQLRSIGGPLSIFAAAAVCHVLAVLPDARVEHLPVRKYLVKWDAGWYLDIARHGYPKSVAPRLAFFPAYPLVVRGVLRATPLNPADALLFVALASSALAMVVLWKLTERLCGSTVAYRTVVLTAFAPAGFVLSMGYSEGLFLLFSSATLLMLIDRRWLLAGGFAAVACATRPTGVAVALACAVAAYFALRENRRDLRPLFAPVLAGIGLLAFPLYTWRHNGDSFASQSQESRHWNGSFDFGVSTVRNLAKWAQHPLRDVNLLFFALAIAALRRRRRAARAVAATAGHPRLRSVRRGTDARQQPLELHVPVRPHRNPAHDGVRARQAQQRVHDWAGHLGGVLRDVGRRRDEHRLHAVVRQTRLSSHAWCRPA